MDVKRVFAKLTWTQLLGNLFGALLTSIDRKSVV